MKKKFAAMAATLLALCFAVFPACDKGGARFGQRALVFGAGCIGLVSVLALKALGVSEVYVVDVVASRLQKAEQLGASAVVNGAEEDVAARLAELTGGEGIDLAVETSGSETAANQAIEAAKKGSVIVFVGYGRTGRTTLSMSLALDKELTFKTVFRYRHIYPLAIRAVAEGRVNLKGVVSHVFGFDELQRAMDLSVSDKERIVKAVVKIG